MKRTRKKDVPTMSNKLVAYFSATGKTECLARQLAETVDADLYEIKPQVPYTEADLDWEDPNSRSTMEMKDPKSRPAIAGRIENMEEYDTVYVGFPIWWYVAPTIINTFLESYDMTGKTVVIFATSGGSGMGKTLEKLKDSCPGAELAEGIVLKNGMGTAEISDWLKSLT